MSQYIIKVTKYNLKKGRVLQTVGVILLFDWPSCFYSDNETYDEENYYCLTLLCYFPLCAGAHMYMNPNNRKF